MFDNNLGKCGPISKFFHQLIRDKILYVYTQRLPPHLQYVATLPRERKPEMFLILMASSTNCWYVPENTLNTWLNIWQ